MKRLLVVMLVLVVMGGCKTTHIFDRPVVFDQERIDLTLQYLDEHYGIKQTEPTIVPKIIVVHYTVIPTLEKTIAAFNGSKLPNWRPEIASAGALNVSSQFVVDQDGKIYRLMPENYMARHVIGLNHCAIGIENVGGTEEVPLTKAQVEANVWLANYLKKKYDIQYLIGHSEYTNFEEHELWLEKDAGYRTEKSDPGDQFLSDIRAATIDLGFKPVPQKKTLGTDSEQ